MWYVHVKTSENFTLIFPFPLYQFSNGHKAKLHVVKNWQDFYVEHYGYIFTIYHYVHWPINDMYPIITSTPD